MTRYITKTHLSLHGLEISTHVFDLWNVSFCGRVWLSFCLTQFHCPLKCRSWIKHYHSLWKQLSLCPSLYPRVQSSCGFPSLCYCTEILTHTLRKAVHIYSTLLYLVSCLFHFYSLTQRRSWRNIQVVRIWTAVLPASSHTQEPFSSSSLASRVSVSNLVF